MQNQELFPTFKGWLRAVVAPKKRARHTLGKRKSRSVTLSGTQMNHETGDRFGLDGKLKPGMDSKYAINGADFVIDDDTWIFGDLAYGVRASVEGVISEAGERLAAKVVMSK